jgi:trimeric autotransporter adhesin
VRAAFGKRRDQPGFDTRADVVVDGVIDIKDLAFVASKLPQGLTCP